MDHIARCAFVNAQVACMLAELASMQAQNAMCAAAGIAMTYSPQDFLDLENKYIVGHNAVIEYLRQG